MKRAAMRRLDIVPKAAAALGVALLVATLLPAKRSRATIVVEGDQAFKDKVAQALKDIKDADSGLKQQIEKLENSGNTHKITKTAEKTNTNTANSGQDARNGTGTGSTTAWNPDNTTNYVDNGARDPTGCLAHELKHACLADKGKSVDTVDKTSGIDDEEIEACRCENVYRTAKGIANRMKYGGKDLPAIALPTTTTTSSTTTMPPTSTTSSTTTTPPTSTTATSMPP